MIMAERGSLNWYCTDYWSERLSVDINQLKAEVVTSATIVRTFSPPCARPACTR